MPSPSPASGLKLMLLGGFDVTLGGRSLAGFSYNKMRALLAYLAVEREQDHPREFLAEMFWRSSDPVTARGNLRRTLSQLRRVLELATGVELFSVSNHAIRFLPNTYVDAVDFVGRSVGYAGEEEALALYGGDFLAGLTLTDCPDFDEWQQSQRESMQLYALALLEKLSDRHEQQGDYAAALPFSLRYLDLQTWDEGAVRRAMRLYALNGQENTALAQYRASCGLLKKELGVLPGEKTIALAQRIESGDLVSSHAPANTGQHHQAPHERRQLSVLYCELAMDATDDPEEAIDLLGALQARCVQIVRQFGGHVVQAHGGGFLAYFGYPKAREDAALLAVRAALSVARESCQGIQIRANVHTGQVITGGLVALPDTVGKTSRVAVELRRSAASCEVAISKTTHALVQGFFDCTSLGAHVSSGLGAPLEIFRVLGESDARNRLDASAQLTPFVGRKVEMEQLMGWWGRAVRGEGQVVVLSGDAGIGKSRMLNTLQLRLKGQPHIVRELRCFPEFSHSPFYPLIALLEFQIGFAQGDSAQQKFAKLAQHAQAYYPATAQEVVSLLTQLLSLPLPYQPLQVSPQKLKEQTIAIVLNMLYTRAEQSPMLLIVEDLHWIDPSTLELLSRFVAKKAQSTMLAIFSTRPDFVAPWELAAQATLTLQPLSGDEVGQMIASIDSGITASKLKRIVARADGVPLFAEEIVKVEGTHCGDDVPATLRDLLAARMENSGEAKYTAQLASILGREFNLGLLSKVFPLGEQALSRTLKELQDAGLVVMLNRDTGQFRHALIQEAAYESQTRKNRQAAHRRTAQAMLDFFPEQAASLPEVVAQHFSKGEQERDAIEYWIKAGQLAALKSAGAEAVDHFTSGLLLALALPAGGERDRLEFQLRINQGTVLIAAEGYGSAAAASSYARALALAEAMADRVSMFEALWGMWLTSSSRVGHAHSLELAERLLKLAQAGKETLQLQQAHYAMGNSSLFTGRPTVARRHFELLMALYQPSQHGAMVIHCGENICVSSATMLALALWIQGLPDQALQVSGRALALARLVDHANTLGFALAGAAMLHRLMMKLDTTRRLANEAMCFAKERGLPFWMELGSSCFAWAQSMEDEPGGVPMMARCLSVIGEVMSGSKLFFLVPLIEGQLREGNAVVALESVQEALRIVLERDDRMFESELHRLKGLCLLHLGPAQVLQAQACFIQALGISRLKGAKSLELRAAISLARLWQQQGKPDQGRSLLKEILSRFSEGFDNPDQMQAAQMLAPIAFDQNE